MKKSFISLTTVVVVGIGSMFISNTVQADTVSDLKNKQSEIHSERSSVKENLSDAEAKIADVMIDLDGLNEKIEQVDKALKENKKKMEQTEGKIEDTKAEVDAMEKEIKKLETEIEARFEILKERIVSYQKTGGNLGYMDVIFGSNSFGEFISRVSAVNKITNSDAKLMEVQEKAKKELVDKQDQVEKKLTNLKDMKSELEHMQATIVEQKEQNIADKEELKAKQSKLQALKDGLKVKDSKLASLEAEISQNIAQVKIERERAAAQPVVQQSQSNNSSKSDSKDVTTLSKKESKSTAALPPAPGGGIQTAMTAGYKYIGNSTYVFGGGRSASDIRNGYFDCSGFVSWAFRQGGISLPASTSGLSGVGQKVSYSNAQPGDLVFFNTYKTNGHVGIYLGGGKFIGSQSSTGVAVASMNSSYWSNVFTGHVRRVR
ncbi:coiled-coil domain-containing protein [Virgibacillus flavescens]|uniref:coiled-coil domain-containing protein n=1 Tax=Virgibacillus flavescens TaxID=1611422 RepID=UPI003D356A65